MVTPSNLNVDKGFADSLTSKLTHIDREKQYFLARSNQQWIIDVSLFVVLVTMSKSCSCLVIMSDDLDKNVKSSSNDGSHD